MWKHKHTQNRKAKQGGQRHGAVYRHSDSCRTPRRDSADDPELVPGLETVPMATDWTKNSGIRRSGGGTRSGQNIGALAHASGRSEHGRGEGGYSKLLEGAGKRKIGRFIAVLNGWNRLECPVPTAGGRAKAHPLTAGRRSQTPTFFQPQGGEKMGRHDKARKKDDQKAEKTSQRREMVQSALGQKT